MWEGGGWEEVRGRSTNPSQNGRPSQPAAPSRPTCLPAALTLIMKLSAASAQPLSVSVSVGPEARQPTPLVLVPLQPTTARLDTIRIWSAGMDSWPKEAAAK